MISDLQVPISDAGLFFGGNSDGRVVFFGFSRGSPCHTPSNSATSKGHQVSYQQMADYGLGVEAGALLLLR